MAFDLSLLEEGGWTLRLFFSIFIVIIGVIAGKLSSFLLKKISEKTEFGKKLRPSIMVFVLFIIRWSVYLLFINFAIVFLELPLLAEIFAKVILVLPAITGAIILVLMGFGVAILLKNVIKDVNLPEKGGLLSEVSFYFVWYIFGFYAFRTAFVSIDAAIKNYIIFIWTAVIAIGIVFNFIKCQKNSDIHSK